MRRRISSNCFLAARFSTFAQAAAAAIAEGKSPMYANLGRQDTIYEKADKMLQDWFSDAKWNAIFRCNFHIVICQNPDSPLIFRCFF